MKRTRIVVLASLAMAGCAGLIGVPDLTLDETPADGGRPADTGPLTDVNVRPPGDTGPGPIVDSGQLDADTDADADAANVAVDAATCDLGKVQTDPLNCGACGTSCLGGACNAGKCEALALANIPKAPLYTIVEHGPSVYVSTFTNDITQQGGIWVVPKAGGAAVKYVDQFNAERMVVIGESLYFVVDEATYDDAGNYGGLWKCDLARPIPCVPALVSPAETPNGLSTDKGYIYYSDSTPTEYGIKRIAPEAGAKPSLWRPDFAPSTIWLSDEGFYYIVALDNGGDHVSLIDVFPDAGDYRILSNYAKPNASHGQITGTANALYFTAYDFRVTAGGVVRRVSRPGTAGTTPCDYAAGKNLRPHGLHLADNRIYWTNQGDPANGSVNHCPLDGCCTTPNVVWTGDGEPTAITSDSQALYWSTLDGNVYKIRKP